MSDQTQLAFDFGAPTSQIDPLEAVLISCGLAPNEFILNLNRDLENPHPEKCPSRLFRWPVEYMSSDRTGAESRLLLNHPLLADHPFVREVADKTRVIPAWDPRDEFGRERIHKGRWYHAIDLMTVKHWRDALATRDYTGSWELAQASAFALGWGNISVAIARHVLAEIGAEEPEDRSRYTLLGNGIWPTHIGQRHPTTRSVKSESRPVNIVLSGPAAAWLTVHGIEDGWFQADKKSGGLQMSAEGLRRREMEHVA